MPATRRDVLRTTLLAGAASLVGGSASHAAAPPLTNNAPWIDGHAPAWEGGRGGRRVIDEMVLVAHARNAPAPA